MKRPPRATNHCRHYSYEPGQTILDDGPRCAVGCDVTTSGKACMPSPTEVCDKREDYTEEERAAWEAYVAHRMDMLREALLKFDPIKCGTKVMEQGFCMIPSLLLRAQRRLHLNPSQLAVLLQIIDHWWDAARKPYPSKKELSSRLGISERQVQRYITDLENEGLLRRQERYGDHGGRQTNMYDLQGLVDKLAEIEPEFREARVLARNTRT